MFRITIRNIHGIISLIWFKFSIEFYAECAIGFISYWLDMGMQFPREIVEEKILRVMDNSVENLMERFQTK